jgi:hypothetical protein
MIMRFTNKRHRFIILLALLALLSFTSYAHRQINAARDSDPNITWRESMAAVFGGKPVIAQVSSKPDQSSSAAATKTSAAPSQSAGETLKIGEAGEASPAQSGGPYEIVKSVIPGGGEKSTNGDTNINGSLGQPTVETSSGGTYTISSGFWPGGGCPIITVNPATLPYGQLGAAYSQQLTQTGGVGVVNWNVSAGALPGGLSLHPATGLLAGTPTASGSFNFTARATDANSCFGERAYMLTVGTCPVITITPATLPGGLVGTPFNQMLAASGGTPLYSFTLDAGSLPPGLTLATGGLLSGSPLTAGAYNFTIKVTDNAGCMASQSYTVVICTTITVNPATIPNGFVGTPYDQTFTATDGMGTILPSRRLENPFNELSKVDGANCAVITWSLSAGTLPTGLSLSGVGVLSGTPTATGTFNFTIRATDTNNCLGERAYTVIISGNGLQFYPLPSPVRLLDTRNFPGVSGCTTAVGAIAANATRTQPARTVCSTIPATATALIGNITVIPAGPGYLTLFPSDAAQPTVANSNFKAGEITNNFFTVGLGAGDGAFKIFTSATTEVIIDLTGYYAPPGAGGLYYHPLPNPVRLVETRANQPGCFQPPQLIGANDPNANPALDLQVQGRGPGLPTACNSLPNEALVLVGNATTVFPQAPFGSGYLTIYPSDAPRPTVASSNYATNDIINGPFAVKLGADGRFKVYTFSTTDLVIDITGYYSTSANDANGAGLLFTPLPKPMRLLETRDFAGLTGCYTPRAVIQGGTGGIRTQPAWGPCADQAPLTIPTTARALVGNATVINPVGAGFGTFFPGDLGVAPTVATTNFPFPVVFGYNRHYYVGLSPGDGTFKILTQFTSDYIVDVSGYFAP